MNENFLYGLVGSTVYIVSFNGIFNVDVYPALNTHQNIKITLNEKRNRGKLTEDPIITQLRVADEEILAEMEKTGTDFEKYNGLVTKRHNFTWNMKNDQLMIQRGIK